MDVTNARSDIRSAWIDAMPSQVDAGNSDPARIARWWGADVFTSTIDQFDLRSGGDWRWTLHGPDGKDYANVNRFARLVADRLFEIEHLNGHPFVWTVSLTPKDGSTDVRWQQIFDTVEHHQLVAEFVATANAPNLEHLAAEVHRMVAPGGQA